MDNNNKESQGNGANPDFTQFPVLNNKSIEKFQSLTSNQPELLHGIMESFIEEASAMLVDIEDSINKSDSKKFQEYVHTFKGLVGTIGASRVFEITKYIDENNKQENFDTARIYYPQLKSNYEELKNIIKEKFLQ